MGKCIQLCEKSWFVCMGKKIGNVHSWVDRRILRHKPSRKEKKEIR